MNTSSRQSTSSSSSTPGIHCRSLLAFFLEDVGYTLDIILNNSTRIAKLLLCKTMDNKHASMSVIILVVCFILAPSSAAGNTIMGYKNYTEYQEGDANTRIIITSPHGGFFRPDDIPDREAGCRSDPKKDCQWGPACQSQTLDPSSCRAVLVNDYNTRELALLLRDEIEALTGSTPHLIASNLYRKKLDANRDKGEAAQGNSDAEQAWEDFHGFISKAKQKLPGRGLLLDIHGQSHTEKWIELGYLFSRSKLDANLTDYNQSSIKHLFTQFCDDMSFDELLRGPSSFGGLLQQEGYKAVPSPAHPGPAGGSYYGGGYITRQYGSWKEGVIDAIQIESPRVLRSSDSIPAYAKSLAKAINQFLQLYYKDESSTQPTMGDQSDDNSAFKNTIPVFFVTCLALLLVYLIK